MRLINAAAPNGSLPLAMALAAFSAAPNGSHPLSLNVSGNVSVLNASSVNVSVVNASGNVSGLKASHLHSLPEAAPAFMLHLVLAMAIVASAVLYITPVSLAVRALKEQVEVKVLAGWLAPTYLIFAQSYLWAWYGYTSGLSELAHFNALGAAVCLMYLGLIARNVQPREVVQPAILLAIGAMLVFSIGVFTTCSTASARAHAFGYSAALLNIGMILAPLPDAARVLKTGTLGDFPLSFTVASFFSSLLWAQYSVLVHSSLYLIPNLIGAIVCGGELLAIYWVVWGGGAIGGANGLLHGIEGQPLMPRVRDKKNGMSSCSDLINILSGGARSMRHDRPRNVFEGSGVKLWDQQSFDTFSEKPAATPTRTRPSTFSAFGHTEEGLGTFADNNEEESDYETESSSEVNVPANLLNAVIERGAALSGGFGIGGNADNCSTSRAVDCIL